MKCRKQRDKYWRRKPHQIFNQEAIQVQKRGVTVELQKNSRIPNARRISKCIKWHAWIENCILYSNVL